MIRASVTQSEGMAHDVEVDGHKIRVDEPGPEGLDSGPSPTRLLTAALASCTAMTIRLYAERKEWNVDGLEVITEFDGAPKVADTAHFRVHLKLPAGLDEEQIGRIREIAGKCPVHRTITGKVEVAIDHEVVSD